MTKPARLSLNDSSPESSTAAALEADRRLFAELYGELHQAARRQLRRVLGATLSPTTLLHETYLSLTRGAAREFRGREHLMSYAARAMRGLIVDYLRRRHSVRRGGDARITELPAELSEMSEPVDERLDKLSEAIERLQCIDPRLAECVELRFFCGLSLEQIAALRSMSSRTVRRDWESARLLLKHFMESDPPSTGSAP